MAEGTEIVIRLRCKEGCLRLRVNRRGSISDLLSLADQELQKKKSKSSADLISKDPRYSEVLPKNLKISEAQLKDGEMLFLKLTTDQIPQGVGIQKGSGSMTETTKVCSNHGPNASCVQCMLAKRIDIRREKEPSIKGPVGFDMTAGSRFQHLVVNELIFQVTRLGILYGTVSESETQVHFVYEPPQIGEPSSVRLGDGWQEEIKLADSIAETFELKRIGIIVSHADVDHNISTNELMMASELYKPGTCAFLFLVMAIGESGEPGLEAFEITKRFFELSGKDLFSCSEKPAITKTSKEIYVDKQYCHSIDNDYFLLPLGIAPFESFLRCEFPIENRGMMAQPEDLMKLMEKYKHISFQMPLVDFHALLFLAKLLDCETVTEMAFQLYHKEPLGEGFELLIRSVIDPSSFS